MSACLVEQLFRQKIGLSIDRDLVSEHIWPLLFKEKHFPRRILQDIHLVRQDNPDGHEEDRHSAIMKVGSDSPNIRSLRPPIRPIYYDSVPQRTLHNLCAVDIVNKIRSLKNPTIMRTRCMGYSISVIERSDISFMARSDTTLEMDYIEYVSYLREQQILDGEILHALFNDKIRGKAPLLWSISSLGDVVNNPIGILT